jgi:hypothetical protein
MMKLEAFVEDKRIAQVLHALNGLVVQMSVGPVANAKAGKGGVVGKGQPTSGREVVSQIINKALAAKKTTLERKDVTTLAVATGIPPARAYAAMQAMQKEKVIKLTGNGTYKINHPVLKVESK